MNTKTMSAARRQNRWGLSFALFTQQLSQGPRVMALAAATVTVLGLVNGADFPLSVPYLQRTTGQNYLDMCAFCSGPAVCRNLENLGGDGRALQGWLLVTIDVLIPVLSFAFGMALLGFLLKRHPRTTQRPLVLWLPVLALGLDVFENIGIATLLATYPQPTAWVATLVGLLSGVKFLAYGSVGLVALSLWLRVFKASRKA